MRRTSERKEQGEEEEEEKEEEEEDEEEEEQDRESKRMSLHPIGEMSANTDIEIFACSRYPG